MSPVGYVLLILIYLAASFVQGLAGFAFGMISLPLLSIIFTPVESVGMLAVLATVLIAYNYFLHREGVEYRRVLPLCIAAALLIPIGAYFLHHLPARTIMAALGAVILSLSAFGILFREAAHGLLSRRWVGFLFAGASGLLGGAFSSPGPPIVVYLYSSDTSKKRAKANAQFYFLIVSLAIVVTHVAARTITAHSLVRSLPYLPVVLAGTKLGAMAAKRMPVALFRRTTDIGLMVLGAYLLIRNLLVGGAAP